MPWTIPDELDPQPKERIEELEVKVKRLEEIVLELFHSPRDAPLYPELNKLPELRELVHKLEQLHGLRR